MVRAELMVFAHLPGGFVPAGRLTLTEEGTALLASSFAYGLRYLERKGRFEIDPVSLAIDSVETVRGVELFPSTGLTFFGAMRDAAPDAWGRRVIEARHKVPANSLPESAYLLEAGSDRVGALDVRSDLNAPPRAGASHVRSLSYLLEAVERVESGLPLPANLADLLDAGPTAGGARPKASVRDDTGLLWLAKFPSRQDAYDVASAEHVALRLAAACGLSVPETRLVDVGQRSVLLVRRFDRYWGLADEVPERKWVLHETKPQHAWIEGRLPYVSGLTLLGCDESASSTKSYADLAHALRTYGHPTRIRTDLAELFARMVFNIFVSNDDDHLRNHAFLRDPRLPGWVLSPLYDVVPRPGVAQERFLHLGVGSQGKLATLDNAMSAHSAFVPSRSEALAAIARVWRELRQWRVHCEALGAAGALIDALARALRDLDDICSPALAAEIRRAPTAG